jgi:DNA modification methylase
MTLLLQGDARDVLRAMPDGMVNQVATSPPYWRQRNYGDPRQIGQEQTLHEFLEHLWAVFDEARRVLTKDGTCWVNLGDKYVGTCAQLIPEQFAVGMKKRGWLVRNTIIWRKPNCKPESVKSRFTNDWEPIYFFAKSEAHYFRQQFEPYSSDTIERCERFVRNGEGYDPSRHKPGDHDPSQAPMLLLERIAKNLIVPGQTPHGIHLERNVGNERVVFDDRGRNMRSVWSIPTAGYRGLHFAVWPPRLIARILRAGCPKGGVVLDPFVGSGTTLAIAEGEGCSGIGIDLREDYLDMATQRVLKARTKLAKSARPANLPQETSR